MNKDIILTVIYARHGESYGNIPVEMRHNAFYEEIDPPLTETGKEQARLLGERLSKGKLDAIYSSTFERAVDTACESAKRQGDMPVILLPDLMETGTPANCKGMSEQVLRHKYPLAIPPAAEPTLTGGGFTLGEEDGQLREKRARRVIEFLRRTYTDGETVALFSHGGFFRYFISAALKIPISDGLKFSCFNTGVTKVKFYGDGSVKLSFSNDTAHLSGLNDNLTYAI